MICISQIIFNRMSPKIYPYVTWLNTFHLHGQADNAIGVTSQLLISTKIGLSVGLRSKIFLRTLMDEFYHQKILARA